MGTGVHAIVDLFPRMCGLDMGEDMAQTGQTLTIERLQSFGRNTLSREQCFQCFSDLPIRLSIRRCNVDVPIWISHRRWCTVSHMREQCA